VVELVVVLPPLVLVGIRGLMPVELIAEAVVEPPAVGLAVSMGLVGLLD
jgi:hypothetical protein